MGSFDAVYVKCPSCSERVKFQSKAGDCDLREYSPDRVPPEIAKDLDGYSQTCPGCQEQLTLRLERPLRPVAMLVIAGAEKTDEEEDG